MALEIPDALRPRLEEYALELALPALLRPLSTNQRLLLATPLLGVLASAVLYQRMHLDLAFLGFVGSGLLLLGVWIWLTRRRVVLRFEGGWLWVDGRRLRPEEVQETELHHRFGELRLVLYTAAVPWALALRSPLHVEEASWLREAVERWRHSLQRNGPPESWLTGPSPVPEEVWRQGQLEEELQSPEERVGAIRRVQLGLAGVVVLLPSALLLVLASVAAPVRGLGLAAGYGASALVLLGAPGVLWLCLHRLRGDSLFLRWVVGVAGGACLLLTGLLSSLSLAGTLDDNGGVLGLLFLTLLVLVEALLARSRVLLSSRDRPAASALATASMVLVVLLPCAGCFFETSSTSWPSQGPSAGAELFLLLSLASAVVLPLVVLILTGAALEQERRAT